MYRDLGFIRVEGKRTTQPERDRRRRYAYLIYPHKPIVAYVPSSRRLLSEYCVEFPDLDRRARAARLPASDDVLAKWMALTGDEQRLIRDANMHLPGRQVDPARVRRDLWRLPSGSASAAAVRAPEPGTPVTPTTLRSCRSRDDPRGPGSRRRARLPQGHRLRRRDARAADRRHRQHLDRDDAVQLPPARASPSGSRRASAPPAARRWSSTPSRSPTASRWAPRACAPRSSAAR